MDVATRKKWDRAARSFDRINGAGPEKRWGPFKRDLFARMQGRVLFVAVGTGLDMQFFPPGKSIVGIDISPKMIEKAQEKAQRYDGELELRVMDVHELDYPEGSFDQVFTSCTFCSVPRPVEGLRSLRRVLVPGGELHMFEHTGSRFFPFGLMLKVMTPLSRLAGPELDRDTVTNVERAGFTISGVENVYLDVVRLIHARTPGRRLPER